MENRIPVVQPVVYSLYWLSNPFKYINLKYPMQNCILVRVVKFKSQNVP
jgi:hypothetical protein